MAGWSSDRAHVLHRSFLQIVCVTASQLSLGETIQHKLSVRQAAELIIKATRDVDRWSHYDDRWPWTLLLTSSTFVDVPR